MTTPPHKPIVRASDEHAAEPPITASIGLHRGGGSARPSSPHSGKFRAALGGLAGIAVAAIVLTVALLVRGGDTTSTGTWSIWKPQDTGASGAREIADHLAPLYRISGTDQLAVVTVANVSSSSASGSGSGSSSGSSGLQVAVQADPSHSTISLLQGHTVAYNLCGIGSTDCSITVGTPSSDRLLLLRREALELALYTFKYVSGTDNVVALLPPGHTTQASTLTSKPPSGSKSTTTTPAHFAILFVRDELQPFLQQPLSSTLPLQFPPMVSQLKLWKATADAAIVAQITERGLFSQHLSQTQDGSNLLVLDPLPPQ